MQSYEVASDVSTDTSGKRLNMCNSHGESNMQSYEVASDVSTDTRDT